jgi:flagellar biosynthesis anti-sigma factor FlgM
MRIDLNQTPQALPESSRSGGATGTSAASAETRAAASSVLGEDQAQLSGGHVQVQALVAVALQFPEIRQEKVSTLRQAVEGGSYHPGSQQVADAVFAHLLVEPAA